MYTTDTFFRGRPPPAAQDLDNGIAATIEDDPDITSCTAIYGTESDGGHYNGYAYEATVTGLGCDTNVPIFDAVQAAVKKFASDLHRRMATEGCSRFTYAGSWTGYLRLTTDSAKISITSIACDLREDDDGRGQSHE